ncbi:MAG: hypothetical protein ABI120_19905 [Gemmatimonadaceae bacterium]
MTLHHPTEHTLNQLVDGTLGSDAPSAAAHVSRCAECASYVQRVERLRLAVAALPRDIVPPPAVWSAIEAQIGARATMLQSTGAIEGLAPSASTNLRVPVRRMWWRALAASVVVAVGAGVVHLAGVYRRTTLTSTSANSAQSTAVVRDSTLRYGGLVDADNAIIERVRATLARERPYVPADVAIEVETRLRSLTTAMVVTQAALASDPNNVQLEAMVDRTRRQRVEYVNSTLALLADY